MKIFTKICVIAAGIAVVLGVVGVGAGLVMGADLNDLRTMGIYLTPHQKVLVNGIIVNDVEDSIENDKIEEYIENIEERTENSLHHSVTEHNYHKTENLHNDNLHNYSCNFQDIERLKIDVQNAEIAIFSVEEADSITYYSNIRNDISKKDGSTLKIVDHASLDSNIELEIFIPIGILKEIEIDAAAGTLFADKIVADNVSLEIDAASVQIDELTVKETAELQIDAGEMVIGYFEGPKLDTECAMGSIMVVCEGNRNDYNYELECGMGNIQIDEDSYSGVGEDIRVNNGGEKSIKAECAMGEILLEFPNSL